MLRFIIVAFEIIRLVANLLKRNRRQIFPLFLKDSLVFLLANWDIVAELIQKKKIPKDFIKKIFGLKKL